MMTRSVDDLGASRHLVQLGDARRAARVYWVRLRQGTRSLTMRAVVVRPRPSGPRAAPAAPADDTAPAFTPLQPRAA
jgi:hypothetical protein